MLNLLYVKIDEQVNDLVMPASLGKNQYDNVMRSGTEGLNGSEL